MTTSIKMAQGTISNNFIRSTLPEPLTSAFINDNIIIIRQLRLFRTQEWTRGLQGQANICSYTRVHPSPLDLCLASGQPWPGQRLREKESPFIWVTSKSELLFISSSLVFFVQQANAFVLVVDLCPHDNISSSWMGRRAGHVIIVHIIIPYRATLCIFSLHLEIT